MATTNYRIRSRGDKNVSIYIVLTLGRGKKYRTPTGFTIHPDYWKDSSKQFGFPKNSKRAEIKNIKSALLKLSSFIDKAINIANEKGEFIDTNWLKSQIDICFDRTIETKKESNLLIDHIQYIIDNAAIKVLPSGRTGLSERRVKSYVTFKGIIEKYEKYNKKQIDLKHINTKFGEDLKNWLFSIEDYSTGNVGRVFIDLKATCNDAIRHGKEVNPLAKTIVVPSVQKEDKYIIPLSFNELEIIENLNNLSDSLENVRKWLLFGCEIGQRGGDLLEITEDNFRITKDGKELIDIFQEKTKKNLSIGVSPKAKRVIENGLPYKISIQKFNFYLKVLCKNAEIDQSTEGELYKMVEKGKKRKIKGFYPKYKLITSHSCRKSFATNYFYEDYPIRVLRGITGHSTERAFLDYIGEQENKDENALLMLERTEIMEQKRKAKMKVVNKKAN